VEGGGGEDVGSSDMPLGLAVAELEALFSGSDDMMLLQTGNTPRSVAPGVEGGGGGGGGGGDGYRPMHF
jgi:hypothetical protein